MLFRWGTLALILTLSACKPPATDDAARGTAVDTRAAPSAPIDSPDVEGAMWAPSAKVEGRLLYGKPGEAPLLALTCDAQQNRFSITRYVIADPEAQALMAMIGNGHIARLPVDAEWNERVWLWQGHFAPALPDLDVLSGPRQVDVTIPGAGSLILIPSPEPGALLDRCRRLSQPQGENPGQPDAAPLPEQE